MSLLNRPYFHNEIAAYAYLEGVIWPDGPTCPHCGNADSKRIGVLSGVKSKAGVERIGLKKCYACRQQFTVKVGTVYESSHIPLHKWLQATYLLCSSKKGFSAHQLHRVLEITYKSAWFMAHRIREAMRDQKLPPLGGEGKTVEIDETYVGGKEKNKHNGKRNPKNIGGMGKAAVLSLVERGGKVRSQRVYSVSARNLRPILAAQIDRPSAVMTDMAGQYHRPMTDIFASHGTVNHSIHEYVRGGVHTNTIESFFAILKRGVTGTYHHVSQQHLKRYLAEFDFRYNERSKLGVEDAERTDKALKGIVGKRLTYRRLDEAVAG